MLERCPAMFGRDAECGIYPQDDAVISRREALKIATGAVFGILNGGKVACDQNDIAEHGCDVLAMSKDAKVILENAPCVCRVDVKEAVGNPKHRIIHMLDWHYIPQDLFADEVRLDKPDVSESEIKILYEKFLADVCAVQSDQRKILRYLSDCHGLKTVYIGEYPAEFPDLFNGSVDVVRALRKAYKFDADKKEKLKIRSMMIGSAGQSLIAGNIEHVITVENFGLLLRSSEATEKDPHGALVQGILEAREDEIVRNMPEGGILFLGGGHDLSNNVPDEFEYYRVLTKNYKKAALPL